MGKAAGIPQLFAMFCGLIGCKYGASGRHHRQIGFNDIPLHGRISSLRLVRLAHYRAV